MIRIVCHGDSLTQGAELDEAFRWPALVGHAIGETVINTGIGGDTTAGMTARFPGDVTERKPELVILTGGTNDLWWDLSTGLIQSNLFTMAFQARYHGITPIIGLPTPIHTASARKQPYDPPEGGYEHFEKKLDTLMEGLRKTAEGSDIPVIDFHRLFLDADGKPAGELYLDDGLHPNRDGHRKMATEVIRILRERFLFL